MQARSNIGKNWRNYRRTKTNVPRRIKPSAPTPPPDPMDIVQNVTLARRLPRAGFPDKHLCRLKYVQQISLNPAVGGVTSHVFRANSLFDPDFTGVGHQPLGFDQMMLWFNHYNVLKSTIKVQHLSENPRSTIASQDPCQFGIMLTADGGQTGRAANVEHLIEQRAQQGAVKYGGVYQNSNDSTAYGTFNHRKFFGQSWEQSIFRGSRIANPTEDAYFEVWAASVNGNDPPTHTFLVTIEFYALLSEPVELPQS